MAKSFLTVNPRTHTSECGFTVILCSCTDVLDNLDPRKNVKTGTSDNRTSHTRESLV